MNMRLVLTVTLVLLAKVDLAHADWLENAWGDKSVTAHGSPAITLRRDGVSVVLPAQTLNEAYSEGGLTTKDVLRAFLSRYSPQCSHVLDLNTPQKNLTVNLSLQGNISLKDTPAVTQDELFEAMENIDIPSAKDAEKDKHARIPHITRFFPVLPVHYRFSIDYAPDKIVHCIVPEDLAS
jgi:hypothetical protein